MTKEEYANYASDFYSSCYQTSLKKNSDYTGNSDDPFKNFTSVEALGIPAELGFMTRMMDKMSRLGSFSQRGFVTVQDESIEDTLKDLSCYCCLFAAFLKNKKEAEK